MYGNLFLLERENGPSVRAERLAFGETSGRNEAWLRDTLLDHPDLLPIDDIDSSFSPLIPLCKELTTPAGRIDLTFINSSGLLTLVECKLWRNPQARREVVDQVLDYARAISQWSYSDLQRQVGIASRKSGNVPYEAVRAKCPGVAEHDFVDSVARSMRSGRFLLLIAGDGIREDVGAIAELINRNAALGFSFGLVEIALYGLDDGSLVVQPRTLARTQLIERTVVVVRDSNAAVNISDPDQNENLTLDASSIPDNNALGESPKQAAYRQWWLPVINSPLDDPDQEPPKLYWQNHVKAMLPWPGTWIVAWKGGGDDGEMGVATGGRKGADQEMLRLLEPVRNDILAELPEGTVYREYLANRDRYTFGVVRRGSEFRNDDERRAWFAQAVNAFVNALRPRVKHILQVGNR